MNEFKIYDRIDNLIIKLHNQIVCNIPKSHATFRNKILDEAFSLASNCVRANENVSSIRNKYQKELLVNISNLDLLIGIIKKLGMIENKKFMDIIKDLNEIKKMVYGWLNSEKKKM